MGIRLAVTSVFDRTGAGQKQIDWPATEEQVIDLVLSGYHNPDDRHRVIGERVYRAAKRLEKFGEYDKPYLVGSRRLALLKDAKH